MGVAVFRGKRSAELLFIVHAAPTAAEQLSQSGTQKRYRALPGSPGECTTPVRHCPRALPAKLQFAQRIPVRGLSMRAGCRSHRGCCILIEYFDLMLSIIFIKLVFMYRKD